MRQSSLLVGSKDGLHPELYHMHVCKKPPTTTTPATVAIAVSVWDEVPCVRKWQRWLQLEVLIQHPECSNTRQQIGFVHVVMANRQWFDG